jgi:hypothetical protein
MESIYLDPTYHVFDGDRLFDLADPILNRDDQLLPFYRLKKALMRKGFQVHTADYLLGNDALSINQADYYSLGMLDRYEKIQIERRAKLAAFVIMEPPVALPSLYKELPKITAAFERVYLPNIHGDGYSLQGVDAGKLRKFYWPIPYNQVLEPYWSSSKRLKRIVVINGNHIPLSKSREQYSLRIKVMSRLSKLDAVDLYGRGWGRWWSRSSMWMPYWLNHRKLMSIYKGVCQSKFQVLQNYEFCLCFENMAMDGYVTEKIFDCLYAGTIPIYLGAPNILEIIPGEVFIDFRNFSSVTQMWNAVSKMNTSDIERIRNAGREFLQSDRANKFYHSMEDIISNGR